MNNGDVIREWDKDKNRQNKQKHGISFEEAKEIFNGIVNNPNVPYQRKVQMAKIFNIPTTVALENLQILQDQYLILQ